MRESGPKAPEPGFFSAGARRLVIFRSGDVVAHLTSGRAEVDDPVPV